MLIVLRWPLRQIYIADDVDGDDPSGPPEFYAAASAVSCAFTHYIVSTRDPVNRTISAFNFGATESRELFTPAMEKLYDGCFASVPGAAAAFAEALEEESECGALARGCLHEPALGCQHIGKGHAYYLRDTGLLEVLRRPDNRGNITGYEQCLSFQKWA